MRRSFVAKFLEFVYQLRCSTEKKQTDSLVQVLLLMVVQNAELAQRKFWVKNTYGWCKKLVLEKCLGEGKSEVRNKTTEIEAGLLYCEFTLHHRMRASWARVNGLFYLLCHSETDEVRSVICKLINDSLLEIDKEMNAVGKKLSNRTR